MFKTPPGPGKAAAFANVRGFLGNRAEFMQGLWREYGDVCRFQLGFFDVYFINDPELVKHVLMHDREFVKTPALRFLKLVLGNGLLLSEGEFHRRQRRLMQPAFHPKRIRTYADLMVRLALGTCERWRDEQEVDIHAEMMQLTMAVASETLFGSSVESETRRVKGALDEILPSIDRIAQPTGAIRMLLPLPSNFRLHRSRKVLNEVIYELIEEGRRSPAGRDDLLSMLLAAQDEEGDGVRMTDRQVRDEVMTLFLAGHETTAVALSWTWYLLARNPGASAALLDELDAVLGGRVPTAEDIPKLAYARMVLAESLRLYPPAYLMDRLTTAAWDVGDYVIPPKKYVFLSPYTMHRNPEYFPEPERFLPERWTPDRIAERPKFSYFPFGGGPRICIGEQFAWTEMILVLATVAQRWELGLAKDQSVGTQPLITLRPKDGIRMIPRRLRNCA